MGWWSAQGPNNSLLRWIGVSARRRWSLPSGVRIQPWSVRSVPRGPLAHAGDRTNQSYTVVAVSHQLSTTNYHHHATPPWLRSVRRGPSAHARDQSQRGHQPFSYLHQHRSNHRATYHRKCLWHTPPLSHHHILQHTDHFVLVCTLFEPMSPQLTTYYLLLTLAK